jgi:uncharacterized protein HemX
MNPIWIAALALVAGGAVGYAVKFFQSHRQSDSLEKDFKAKQEAAEIEAKTIVITAKDKAAQIVAEAQTEERETKQELRRLEDRLTKKEDQLNEERNSLTKDKEKILKKVRKYWSEKKSLKK